MQEMLNPLRDPASREATYQIDDIRQAMLRCLDEDCLEHFPHVERRILMASNVPALWFLRPELLMALSVRSGEQAAHETIDEISAMFDGLLPKSLNSRPAACSADPIPFFSPQLKPPARAGLMCRNYICVHKQVLNVCAPVATLLMADNRNKTIQGLLLLILSCSMLLKI